jgi:2-keto-3-deoxy-L-rhamnonate aldolase RhmA
MYSTKEIEKFEELSEALDLINASNYTEAQIRGIEHYLDTMRYNNSLLEGTRNDTLKEVLLIMAEIKNGSALDEIALKYGVDIAYVIQLKEQIREAVKS